MHGYGNGKAVGFWVKMIEQISHVFSQTILPGFLGKVAHKMT